MSMNSFMYEWTPPHWCNGSNKDDIKINIRKDFYDAKLVNSKLTKWKWTKCSEQVMQCWDVIHYLAGAIFPWEIQLESENL